MSELFEGYERQYLEISVPLSRKCAAASALHGEKKKQKLSEIQADVQESESLIRKMDLEACSLQLSVKAALVAKLRDYKHDLTIVKGEVKRISAPDAHQATREELLEAGMYDTLAASADQRGRLMMTSERLNQSSDRIRESQETAYETEETGVLILQDLHNQRQSLLHAHTTLHGVDDYIGKSKKMLASMSKRMDRNKRIFGGIITALVFAILFILYFKFAR